METLQLPAILENLDPFIGFVHSGAASFGLSDKRILEVELALEEALVNVFQNAYPGGDGWVEVRFGSRDTNQFVIEIIDEGIPFDPLARPDPNVDRGIEEREVGGLGIFLVKDMIDHVEYRREGAMNILTFQVFRE